MPTDSLGDPQNSVPITVSAVSVDPVDVGASPVGVANWAFFDGALLAVCLQYGSTYKVEGTAVMIGVGLAISAKHVLVDHRVALRDGEATLLCGLFRNQSASIC